MSADEGVCDYCGRGRLMETGDERSVINPGGKLWCGTCREGSRDRFKSFNDRTLEALAKGCKAALENDPIRWDDQENPETLEERAMKLGYQDEGWRIERELSLRAGEAG